MIKIFILSLRRPIWERLRRISVLVSLDVKSKEIKNIFNSSIRLFILLKILFQIICFIFNHYLFVWYWHMFDIVLYDTSALPIQISIYVYFQVPSLTFASIFSSEKQSNKSTNLKVNNEVNLLFYFCRSSWVASLAWNLFRTDRISFLVLTPWSTSLTIACSILLHWIYLAIHQGE